MYPTQPQGIEVKLVNAVVQNEPGPLVPGALATGRATVPSVSRPERIQSMALVSCAMTATSGQLKELPVLSLLPGHFTVLSTLCSLALGILYSVSSRTVPAQRQLAVVGLLYVTAIAGTMTYVPADYAADKVTRMFLVLLPAAVAAALVVRSHADGYRLVRYIVAASFVLSIFIALAGQQQFGSTDGRLRTEFGATITFGRAAGFVVVALVAWVLTTKQLSPWKLALVGAAVVFEVWTTLSIGSKGPIQAAVLGILAMVALQLRRVDIRSALRILSLGGALAVAAVAVWGAVPRYSRERILEAATGGSARARTLAWEFTWKRLDGAPFGDGWGSWEVQESFGFGYAHNIILEVWFEAGVVGLVALLVALWIPSRHQVSLVSADRPAATLAIGAIAYWLGAGLVSGDLNANKVLFVILVAVVAPAVRGSTAQSASPAPSFNGAQGVVAPIALVGATGSTADPLVQVHQPR